MKTFLSLLFLLTSLSGFTQEISSDKDFPYTFEGPKNWKKIVESLPPKVMVAYVGSSAKNLSPSINLAIEKADCDLITYIKKAKKWHEEQTQTTCADLGTIATKAGKGRLLQIQSQTNIGTIQFFQAIILKKGIIYVLTATAMKEEFPSHSVNFLKCIKNFNA